MKIKIALLLGVILWTLAQASIAEDNPAMTQQIEGFNLQGYSEGGEKTWDITGEKADIVGDKVAVTNIDANAYGEQDMNLKAKQGVIDKATGDVSLEKDVVITSEQGAVMKTDTLEWQRQNDLVKTEDLVLIEDKSMRVQGVGLEAHPSLKDATLKSDVMADIKAKGANDKDNRIQITSDGPMEVDQVSKTATFWDNVVAIEVATGRKLRADKMEIIFDDQTKKIPQIHCIGNVEVTQDNNVTHSEELVYKADEQRMILKGRPKLVIDPGDHATGDVFKF